ncbi:MAG: peroxiredoxin-like family protein [Verrucomicrobiota bacterium]|jgi:peroxiredoxin
MKTIFCALLVGAALARAETIPSALKVGDSIPDVTLRTVEDKEVRLRKLVADKPAVLVFYRGGWCPFCNLHLQSLAGIQDDLAKEGVQLIAISMDQPSKLRETMQKDKLDYTLLSDSDARAVKAFGISYKVDDATLEKMKTHNVDLDAAAGNSNHILPHPAVFVVNTRGVIRFVHVNPDFKVRLEPSKVLEAAKRAKE